MGDYRRHKKDSGYTQIDNYVFWDNTLSMKAKGLLTQIFSLPEDWEYSVRGLASLFKDGKEAVNNALQELVDHGYIIRTQKTNVFGRFEGYEYDIYERPQIVNVSEKPFTENPSTENPPQLNTNKSNIDILDNTNTLNTNINILDNDSMDNIVNISPEEKMFEEFWEAYPNCFRKSNKKGCKTKFIKIKNLAQIFPDILASLELQKKSKQWNEQDGQFIPAPLTWINQERWLIQDTRTELQAKIDEATQQNIDGFLF